MISEIFQWYQSIFRTNLGHSKRQRGNSKAKYAKHSEKNTSKSTQLNNVFFKLFFRKNSDYSLRTKAKPYVFLIQSINKHKVLFCFMS